ncbi:RNA-guided endonuclease InsQ/TnpB family protein [Streptomyces erythrochromogenes]|uniref:RNA-guided endonuclease InsQ/TnpB family protein n=1 Tax=Streptomyces erythrochromogenes TaxID=285574 RepID=UPI00386C6B65|nr:transposase [Streptomyces erythrochromogenes]WST98301.1 transposase [Streptomyces erythrochromogenes]
MHLRYAFRIEPTAGQRIALARTFGCARVVYNDALAARKAAYTADKSRIATGALAKRVITDAKKTPERAWLAEVSVDALQSSLRDLDTAYANFFASVAGKRRGRRMRLPVFKSKKDNRQAVRFSKNGFRLRDNGRLHLAKIGGVRVRWSRPLPALPSSVTVVKDASGRYFVSFAVEVGPEHLAPVEDEVGIDLGLTHYAVLSNGHVIENPRFLRRAERTLRKAQQNLSRKAKGSANRAKARIKVARAHAKVADARRDWCHQTASRLIRDNQAVYLEDLAVSGLARTRLAKSVHDAAWGMFRRVLEEKAARAGRHVGVVSRWLPSSQTCSVCGVVDGKKPLHVRTWRCGACGTEHDRDLNASRVILAAGQAERQNAPGGPVSPGVEIPCQARPVERGTHLKAQPVTTGSPAGIPAL